MPKNARLLPTWNKRIKFSEKMECLQSSPLKSISPIALQDSRKINAGSRNAIFFKQSVKQTAQKKSGKYHTPWYFPGDFKTRYCKRNLCFKTQSSNMMQTAVLKIRFRLVIFFNAVFFLKRCFNSIDDLFQNSC